MSREGADGEGALSSNAMTSSPSVPCSHMASRKAPEPCVSAARAIYSTTPLSELCYTPPEASSWPHERAISYGQHRDDLPTRQCLGGWYWTRPPYLGLSQAADAADTQCKGPLVADGLLPDTPADSMLISRSSGPAAPMYVHGLSAVSSPLRGWHTTFVYIGVCIV